jgi:hypothetical protein
LIMGSMRCCGRRAFEQHHSFPASNQTLHVFV